MARPDLQGLWSALPVLPEEGDSLSPKALKPDYKINPDTGCWEWQKYRLRGYGTGQFGSVGIKTQWAHVAYWIAANGPLPVGTLVSSDARREKGRRRDACSNELHGVGLVRRIADGPAGRAGVGHGRLWGPVMRVFWCCGRFFRSFGGGACPRCGSQQR